MGLTHALTVPRFGWQFVSIGLVLLLAGCAAQVRFQSEFSSLYRPEGIGPFPAMVLLHTCAGVRPHVLSWAGWLKGEGYVALVVDSFSPRGISNACGRPHLEELVEDAFGALPYLRSLPFVDRDRIGVMGWSSGGMATLRAAMSESSFQAAVAFYPGHPHCEMYRSSIPVLLLLAGADDWSPPDTCVYQAKYLQQKGLAVLWAVYPGAHHGFDQAELGNYPFMALGRYTIRYDAGATADADKRIREFLARYLRR